MRQSWKWGWVAAVIVAMVLPGLGSLVHVSGLPAGPEAGSVGLTSALGRNLPALSPPGACPNESFSRQANISFDNDPRGVAYDSARNEVFVAAYDLARVFVISDVTDAVVASVPVGVQPRAVTYDPGKAEVFVANWGSNSVSVISDASNAVVAVVGVGNSPSDLAYDPVRAEVYVANYGSNSVSVVSDVTNAVVAVVPVGMEPDGVAYDPTTGMVYVSNYQSSTVSAIYDGTNVVIDIIPAGAGPMGLAVDPGAAELFVAEYTSASVTVISDATNTQVGTVELPSAPVAVAYNPAKGELYVTVAGGRSLAVISDANNEVIATVGVDFLPWGVAYDSGNGRIFVTQSFNGAPGSVLVISERTLRSYAVTFPETGLLPGTSWYVRVPGCPLLESTQSSMVLSAPNGNYTYRAAPTTGHHFFALTGAFSVNGGALAVPLTFVRVAFALTCTEHGLPPKTLAKSGWTVVLNGTAVHATNASLTFLALPNGTYPQLILGPKGYGAVNSGQVTVFGTTSENVTMGKIKAVTLSFHEKGVPKGHAWCVSVDGYGQCTSTSKSLTYPNLALGTYNYSVLRPEQNVTVLLGKTAEPTSGPIPLTKSVKLVLTYLPTYLLKFTEIGLSSGSWSVSVKGTTETAAAGSAIYFALGNGTYAYKVGTISGYGSVGIPKKPLVNGPGTTVTIAFALKTVVAGPP